MSVELKHVRHRVLRVVKQEPPQTIRESRARWRGVTEEPYFIESGYHELAAKVIERAVWDAEQIGCGLRMAGSQAVRDETLKQHKEDLVEWAWSEGMAKWMAYLGLEDEADRVSERIEQLVRRSGK